MLIEYKIHLFHHLLPRWAYATDIDFVEARTEDLEICAFLEFKINGGRISDFQKDILTNLSRKTNIPVYSIFVNNKLTKFDVWNLLTDKHIKEMKKDEFLDFWGNGCKL